MENHVERLEDLRQAIDRLDYELLDTLQRRMRIVRQVGLLKKEAGLPVLQESRYQELKTGFIAQARKMELDPELADSVIEAIHASSVRIQKTLIAGDDFF